MSETERLEMLHQLLAALGRDFAQPISPAQAWEDALRRVRELRKAQS